VGEVRVDHPRRGFGSARAERGTPSSVHVGVNVPRDNREVTELQVRRTGRWSGSEIRDPVEYLTSSGLACIGTPDDCVRHFERLWLGSNGGFGAVLLLAHNWADWEATKKSYELMARYVHPHFQRQSNTQRVASYDNATAKHATAGAESAKAVETEIERYAAAKGKTAAGGKAW